MSIEPHAPREDVETVIRGLRQFNTDFIGEPNMQSVQILLRDEHDAVVGGLLGHSVYRWMFIAKLWVSADVRGGGLGSNLLKTAEEEARRRDCLGMYLDTFEYQARPFYERHGFVLFGTLDGYPPGYRQFYLAKHLQPTQ
ncbi:MAG TPA: GNAT family N-acetyltransferase [Gemmatimonas sp.]|nr:GNAT family N-acetyltransferase [Gemmatimonas sp.]